MWKAALKVWKGIWRLLLMLEIGLLLSGPCTTSSSTICYFPSPIDILFHNMLFSFPCRHLIPQCVTLTPKGKGLCVLTLRLIYLLNFIFMFELKSVWRIQFIILSWNYCFFANLHHYLRVLLLNIYIYIYLNIVVDPHFGTRFHASFCSSYC